MNNPSSSRDAKPAEVAERLIRLRDYRRECFPECEGDAVHEALGEASNLIAYYARPLSNPASSHERMAKALRDIAESGDWATASYLRSLARLGLEHPGFVRCATCGGEFDEAEWNDATECPECEQPKALSSIASSDEGGGEG